MLSRARVVETPRPDDPHPAVRRHCDGREVIVGGEARAGMIRQFRHGQDDTPIGTQDYIFDVAPVTAGA